MVDGRHYFDASPDVRSERRVVELALPDVFLRLNTDSGVFSADKVDAGTKFLLREMPPIPAASHTIADVGCGYGPIALTAAARSPDSTVWAVDVNDRARGLCAENARLNGIANVEVADPDDVPDDLAVDLIVSNPPIRIGKEALHALLSEWLERLTPDGRAWLVVQKHLGSDSLHRWLVDEGYRVERLGSRTGYRLLEVTLGSGSTT